MKPGDIQKYLELAGLAIQLGTVVYTAVKGAMKANGLTDEEINAIETLIIADARRRQAEREAMAGL